jgi:pyruvate/2-oxoglutarate dehydrogenase complex dihydrolipoamide dehydrogenase (E3) component
VTTARRGYRLRTGGSPQIARLHRDGRAIGCADGSRWHDSRRLQPKRDGHHVFCGGFTQHETVAGVSRADQYDLVVIGGGSAGLTAADFAARIGVRVLIATEQVGGDCTWTGCIPSKTLIRIARLAHDQLYARSGGIGTGEVRVDFPRVMAEVRAAIARVYANETPEVLAKRGIEVTIGAVSFVDAKTIKAGERHIGAKHFVICTGAEPAIPPIPGLPGVPYLTYETVFDLNRLPATLIIVGGGATGVELGQAFARLGSSVTVIDQRTSLLPDADPEAAAIIRYCLESEGVKVQTSAVVTGVTTDAAQVVVEIGTSQLKGDSLLLAAGRRPRTEGLDLERAGVEVHEGAIRVDTNLRTTNPRVYAAGDVTGGFQFTHYAGWQGYVAARNALLPGTQEGLRRNIPWAVFTDPDIAQAGLSEAQARAQFTDIKVHRLELERVDRAQTEDERDGFLKLITTAGGKLVGATTVSRAAGETINELALAIDRELTVSELASTIHAYPTFGFAIQQLAAEATFEAAATGIRGQAMRALRRLS